MSINKAILVGHVGKDPEVRHLDSGVAVATITLATTERGYTLQNGTQVPDRTEWHNVIAWRGLGEIAEKYIKKGSQIYVEGKITTRSWDKEGIKHYRTEIVAESIELLGRKPEANSEKESGSSEFPTHQEPSRAAQQSNYSTSDGGGDDLPF